MESDRVTITPRARRRQAAISIAYSQPGDQLSTTGITDLDALLGGLLPGDNVVWVGDDRRLHAEIERAFLRSAVGPTAVVVTADGADDLDRASRLIDARPGRAHADPVALEQAIVQVGADPAIRIVVDDLDALVARWGSSKALGLFTRTCPRLFDLGAEAYWRASRAGSGLILDSVRGVTQCVLDHTGGRLRVVKAEGRAGVGGRIADITVGPDGVALHEVRALGRLAEGLRQLRVSRGLTQTEVASLAAISPSAVSQAEAGRRGLSLDTLLTLSEALGVTLDELVDHRPESGYVLARRDRMPPRRGIVALLDDPGAGLRSYLVTLGLGESGSPPTVHKGAELIHVAHGVVQIELADDTHVLRAGDALLVTTDAIRGWRNLLPEPARLYWIVRD